MKAWRQQPRLGRGVNRRIKNLRANIGRIVAIPPVLIQRLCIRAGYIQGEL
jgi:hypothetical protein